jgi:hypothetical protein
MFGQAVLAEEADNHGRWEILGTGIRDLVFLLLAQDTRMSRQR